MDCLRRHRGRRRLGPRRSARRVAVSCRCAGPVGAPPGGVASPPPSRQPSPLAASVTATLLPFVRGAGRIPHLARGRRRRLEHRDVQESPRHTHRRSGAAAGQVCPRLRLFAGPGGGGGFSAHRRPWPWAVAWFGSLTCNLVIILTRLPPLAQPRSSTVRRRDGHSRSALLEARGFAPCAGMT